MNLISRPQNYIFRSRNQATENTQLWVFFLSLLSWNNMTSWAQVFTGFLFYAYVEIQLVRPLVFDNYQTCTFPLILFYRCSIGMCTEDLYKISLTRCLFCMHLHSQNTFPLIPSLFLFQSPIRWDIFLAIFAPLYVLPFGTAYMYIVLNILQYKRTR